MDDKELQHMIPSTYVRDYIKETGWTFTDFQKASLLCHRGLPLKDEYPYLKDLGEHTTDHTLREQIMEYLVDDVTVSEKGSCSRHPVA